MTKSEVDLIIESSIALQKVVADLALSLKKLSKDTSDMLGLFKEAAKTISAEKTEDAVKRSDMDELKGKVEELSEQNKIIAKGILLLESALKPKESYPAY